MYKFDTLSPVLIEQSYLEVIMIHILLPKIIDKARAAHSI